MIVTSDDLDAEVLGTSTGDTFVATAWRGGRVVAANLDVTDCKLTWDASGDQVSQGRCSLTVADPDGTLAPWSAGDPLGFGGSLVQISWVSGLSGITVPRGWWRIRSAQPSESWRSYANGTIRISGGGSVTLSMEEAVTSAASICRIDGEAPTSGASVLAEMKRLLVDYGAVDTSLAPADVTVPVSYAAFPESRSDALGDLLDMLSARSRVGGDGALQVIPRAGVGPVWTIQGGETGALIAADRELNDTGVYNAATSRNATTDGASPLVGRAYLTTGPLAWGGPFGKVPTFHAAIATTPGGVQADAATYLETVTSSGTVDLAVTCLAHPALQVHDIVTIFAPTVGGDQALTGRVVAMSWGSAQGVVSKQMGITVRTTVDTLEMIAVRARQG